jgi:hypothetical protein
MAIEFRCNHCGRLLRTGDETAGRMAMCPECGSQTPIPVPETPVQVEPVDVQPLESAGAGTPYAGAGTVPAAFAPRDSQLGENPYRSPGQPGAAPHGHDPYRVHATTSLVLGIIGVVFSIACCVCWPVGMLVSLVGMGFGIVGLRSTTKNGFAVAGIVLSGIAILIGVLILLTGHIHIQPIQIRNIR